MIATASRTSWTRSPAASRVDSRVLLSPRNERSMSRRTCSWICRERLGAPALRPRLGRRLQRRELARAAVDRQLVDVLVLDVLQVRLAEVVDADALGQLVPEQRARRLRDEDLAAVARRADARRAHDVEPDVALVADRRLAGVQPHPHAHVLALRPLSSRSARCAATAASTAERARANEKKNASPCVSISVPSCSPKVSRMIRRCAETTSPYASPSSCSSRVEPSMSVNTNVTVPLGRLMGLPFQRIDARAASRPSAGRRARERGRGAPRPRSSARCPGRSVR